MFSRLTVSFVWKNFNMRIHRCIPKSHIINKSQQISFVTGMTFIVYFFKDFFIDTCQVTVFIYLLLVFAKCFIIKWLSKIDVLWVITRVKLFFTLYYRLHTECVAPRYFPVQWQWSLDGQWPMATFLQSPFCLFFLRNNQFFVYEILQHK